MKGMFLWKKTEEICRTFCDSKSFCLLLVSRVLKNAFVRNKNGSNTATPFSSVVRYKIEIIHAYIYTIKLLLYKNCLNQRKLFTFVGWSLWRGSCKHEEASIVPSKLFLHVIHPNKFNLNSFFFYFRCQTDPRRMILSLNSDEFSRENRRFFSNPMKFCWKLWSSGVDDFDIGFDYQKVWEWSSLL